MLWVDNFSIEASRKMNKKIDKVWNNFVVPSHIEGRSEVKHTKAYSTETFLHPDSTLHPNLLHKKVLSSSEFEITSFASPNSAHKDASLTSVQDISFSSIDSSSALNYSLEGSIRPCDSKTSPSIRPETSPAKVNASNFTTPAKDSSEEDGLPKVIEDPLPRVITPLSSQPYPSTYRKKKNTQLAIITSNLIASSLTSNVESHSVLRPKRMPLKAPPT